MIMKELCGRLNMIISFRDVVKASAGSVRAVEEEEGNA